MHRLPLLLARWALSALALSCAAMAQEGRYRDLVFPNAAVQTDIQYGQAVNRSTQQTEKLRLDLYEPAGDTATLRPAMVVVHGGAFILGNKGMPDVRMIATDFARRGYVAVSMNYRLASTMSRTAVQDASHDMKAAVRWLRANAQQLRIDTSRIAGMGSSAGAITCLETAYVPGEGVSGNPGFSSDVHAVASLSGTLSDLNQLDAGEPPMVIIHGTEDPLVPYNTAVRLKAQADAVGVHAELLTMQGAGHVPLSTYFQSFHAEVVGFFHEQLRLGQLAGLAARAGFASPGSLTLDVFGKSGDFYVLAVAASQVALPAPGLGTLQLDPALIVVVTQGQLPAQPRLATRPWSMKIPAGLQGLAFYWQSILVGAQSELLSNCVTTRL
jgi:acetyl esterase/lipase